MPSHLAAHTKIVRAPDSLFRAVRGRVYIFDQRRGRVYSLNETSSYIWRLMRTPVSVGDIVESIAKRYGISHAVAKADVQRFLQTLYQKTLIVSVK